MDGAGYDIPRVSDHRITAFTQTSREMGEKRVPRERAQCHVRAVSTEISQQHQPQHAR